MKGYRSRQRLSKTKLLKTSRKTLRRQIERIKQKNTKKNGTPENMCLFTWLKAAIKLIFIWSFHNSREKWRRLE